MATAIVKLQPDDLARLTSFFYTEEELTAHVLPRIDDYVQEGGPIYMPDLLGEDAAEEVFELTNNPDRQDEREQRYGRGPSVSSGDIIVIDGVNWLCCSQGWLQLNTM